MHGQVVLSARSLRMAARLTNILRARVNVRFGLADFLDAHLLRGGWHSLHDANSANRAASVFLCSHNRRARVLPALGAATGCDRVA
jgi:hypothetical protein